METILKFTGYEFSTIKKSTSEKSIRVLCIANPDGTPRWIWNCENKKPLFLKFYNVSSKRAWMYSKMIQLIFILRIQRFIFKQKRWFYTIPDNPLFDCNSSWALFTGTVGPNNKAILYANSKFYKIASTENAMQLLQNELSILKNLEDTPKAFIAPNAQMKTNNILELSDVSQKAKRANTISDNHLKVLREMALINRQTLQLENWTWFQQLVADFRTIDDNRIPKNLLRKINYLLQNTSQKHHVPLSFSQGDFTPWNQYLQDNTIALYDWELARPDRPLGFDYFHFVIQQGVMVDQKNWKTLYKDLQKNCVDSKGNCLFDHNIEIFKNQLKWYLLTNCMHYLKVYAAQPKWHIQIYWLLGTWNEALDVFMTEAYLPRPLVIMDFFDQLQNKNYSTLKFPEISPDQLSLNSDIDLVIDKKEVKNTLDFIKNHHLVNHVKVQKYSYMYALQAVLNDGSLLAIDLIWQLKVRNLEIMETTEVYQNNILMPSGIRMAQEIDSARFIGLFYLLNHARVPMHYEHYLNQLKNSQNNLDIQITNCIHKNHSNTTNLLTLLNKNPKNQLHYAFKNRAYYVLDTLKSFMNNNGFVITFSGVDGAGKSTVIEQIAHRIQKQLRKPVVVLRHRPSILPILSVWTKGKEKAHQDVISNLPRQGKNNHPISSLLRFSYYYLDYSIGQFVVYFKYIIRGYVVIYDRYYFDFINDSKRSNIVLPKKLTIWGYHFLMPPDYNFFLYADAITILKRKQELNKDTIEELTIHYKELFDQLQQKRTSSVYKSIHNDDLETTLNYVFQTITMT